jgi:hypothetical protein
MITAAKVIAHTADIMLRVGIVAGIVTHRQKIWK